MSKKLTPWFPATVKPARDGWYEARYSLTEPKPFDRRYFYNGQWFISDRSGMQACFGGGRIAKGEAWRGLAEQPK